MEGAKEIRMINPKAENENFPLNSCGGKIRENERKILTLPAPGIDPVPLARRQVSQPLHHRAGIAIPKNLLPIYTRASGESRLMQAPCRTHTLLLNYI